ncbi:MAG: DUF2251 domain-containing protein [Bacteroidetes bacterium]|nr:DUF2251 domain-containing protein [Bacteroidota bacterium]
MNGYLMQEQQWVPGEDLFIESFAPENRNGVVFEDDGEAAYFYAVERDEDGPGLRILDALHIHQSELPDPSEASESSELSKTSDSSEPSGATAHPLMIVWSRDWLKCALIIDGYAHALFDFEAQGGYNINEFPPPNDFWTKGDRKLTDELVRKFF